MITRPDYALALELSVGSMTLLSNCLRASYSRSIADALTPLTPDEGLFELSNDVGSLSPLLNANLTLGRKVQLTAVSRSRFLSLPGTISNYASTPDSAAVSITGDIDLRAKCTFSDFTVNVHRIWFHYPGFVFTQIGGGLYLEWTPDGSTYAVAASTVTLGAVGIVVGQIVFVRVTCDVDNGAAQREVKFWWSLDGVSWTQLGATVTGAVTSFFDSTDLLYLGSDSGGATNNLFGKIYTAEIRNGIDGTVVAKFDPDDAYEGATSWKSKATGETWTVNQSGTLKAQVCVEPDFQGKVVAQGAISNAHATIASPSGMSNTGLTIECDFSVSSFFNYTVPFKSSTWPTSNGAIMLVNSAQALLFGIEQGGVEHVAVTVNSAVFLNSRYLAHHTWNGSLLASYLNGSCVGTGSTPSSSLNTALTLNLFEGPATYYGARIWNRALTPAEVQDRALGLEVSNTGLILKGDFTRQVTSSGDILRDLSGANNNLTMLNSFAWSSVGSAYNLYAGRVKGVATRPMLGERTTVIEALTDVDRLDKTRLDTGIFTAINAASLFTEIMTRCAVQSFTADALTDSVDYAWYRDRNAATAIWQLVQSGYYQFYGDGAGTMNLKARYFAALMTAVDTVDTQVRDMNYALTDRSIVNKAVLRAIPRRQTTSVATLAYLANPILLPASGHAGFFVTFLDPRDFQTESPVGSIVAMVSSTDYYAAQNSDGTGTNFTTALSLNTAVFGAASVTSIFNANSADVWLTRFQVRGYPILQGAELTVKFNNASSQNAYGLREVAFDENQITNYSFLRDLASVIVGDRALPRDRFDIQMANEFPNVLRYEVGQALSIINSMSGINSTWSIRRMQHEIDMSRGLEHVARYEFDRHSPRPWLVLDHAVFGKLDSNRQLAL